MIGHKDYGLDKEICNDDEYSSQPLVKRSSLQHSTIVCIRLEQGVLEEERNFLDPANEYASDFI